MGETERALRIAHARALATLIRVLGDIDLAEDVVQEAAARALTVWPERGVPDNPAAWLVRVGRNYRIDVARRGVLAARHSEAVRAVPEPRPDPLDTLHEARFDDDLLRLVFTCCHPALSQEAKVALTLKTIAGLSVDEIAAAFLIAPRTMEQRLTRAKRRIVDERIPYSVPAPHHLAARLDAVLSVVYLVFNEGYRTSSGTQAIRLDLCQEAIRLGRMLLRLFRDHAETMGLLALMVLQHSRARARQDAAGDVVPIDEQDRGLWDQALLTEGRALVEKALRQQAPGPYQIQAAIAALHGSAPSPNATDWTEIAALYEILERHQPTPVVSLNRAVAVSRAQGAEAGLAILEQISDDPRIANYLYLHVARAEMLADAGRTSDARKALQRAIALAGSERDRAFLARRLEDFS